MTFGERIASHRKKLELTQDALAQKLGVTNQAVSKWESDQTCPDIQLLPLLTDLFGITLDELFGRARTAQTVEADVPWTDDGVLRVVVYEGRKLICGGAAAKDFKLEYRSDVKEILSSVTVTCENVEGDVYANCHVNCADVGGDVDAGTAVNCGNVGGSVDAGTRISCGNVEGDADAGTSITCGNISGSADAGTSITCGNIGGDADAGGDIRCTGISGEADAGGVVIIRT